MQLEKRLRDCANCRRFIGKVRARRPWRFVRGVVGKAEELKQNERADMGRSVLHPTLQWRGAV